MVYLPPVVHQGHSRVGGEEDAGGGTRDENILPGDEAEFIIE